MATFVRIVSAPIGMLRRFRSCGSSSAESAAAQSQHGLLPKPWRSHFEERLTRLANS
jgi:hypothetical protein